LRNISRCESGKPIGGDE